MIAKLTHRGLRSKLEPEMRAAAAANPNTATEVLVSAIPADLVAALERAKAKARPGQTAIVWWAAIVGDKARLYVVTDYADHDTGGSLIDAAVPAGKGSR
jgi:hypothetical protein